MIWSVCGQTLKWWYDHVPPSSKTAGSSSSSSSGLGSTDLEELEKDEDGVKKYTIEIKRRDGPLHIADNSGGGGGCCEEMCEDGRCLIM